MGAGSSTLTTTDVNRIVDDKGFVKESDLIPLAKRDEVLLKSQASGLYVDESDKASSSTQKDADNKWVTPKWVSENIITSTINETTVAQKLGDNSTFRNSLITPLAQNVTLQSGIAGGLLVDSNKSNFISALHDQFVISDTFKKALSETLTSNEEYKKALQGPAGTFSASAIEQNLWSGTGVGEGKKVMWCADGDICKVPVGKTGIQFTGGDQVILGFAANATDPKVVKVDDRLALKRGNSIEFARDSSKGVNTVGDIGETDARILATVMDGTDNTAVQGSSLEIHGVGKLPVGTGATRRKQVRIFDDLVVGGNIIMGTENGKRLIIHRNATENTFHIAPDNADGTWAWNKEFKISRNGNLTINSAADEAIRIKPTNRNNNWNYIRFADVNNNNRLWFGLNDQNNPDSDALLKNNDKVTIRSERGRRLQQADNWYGYFANDNRGQWETFYLEKL